MFVGHKYHNCQEFLTDIELIYNNCVLYNGVDSPFTMKAEGLLNTSKALLAEVLLFKLRQRANHLMVLFLVW